ncbi:type II secretion system protein GspN [Gammaproteobacteria bacterium]|jgi:general secretion pathway protein N|nr:type II secretion system protein GspN [Gammaproteobacteria bacterium]
MLSVRRAALIGVLTLALGLLIVFPARIAYQLFAPQAVKLAGISGSVWNGSAGEAAANRVYLRDLRWQIRPSQLLTGALAYTVTAKPSSGTVTANVSVGLAGGVTVTDLRAALPLQTLRSVLKNPGLAGSLTVQLDELTADSTGPKTAAGWFEIADLVDPRLHRESLGDYRADISSDGSGILVAIEDSDGDIDIDAQLRLAPDLSYQFVALLAPKASTPPNLRQFMQRLPFADDGVNRIYQFEGRM